MMKTETRLHPSSLEGAWIEIFRAGDYGERGHWTPEDLDRLAAGYDPSLQPAPVVLGHPADDAPAYGWLRRLRRAGQSLWAQLEKVDPAFEALLRGGRFRQRSVSLYKTFPATGGPYIRHLGFLGAAAPAVKGLAPVRFADAATVSFAFDSTHRDTTFNPVAPATGPEEPMPETKSTLDTFVDHLRAFFAPDHSTPPGSADEAAPVDSSPTFAERLAQLEQRLDTLAAQKNSTEEKLSATQSAQRREQVASFVESLRRRGRFPPAFDRWGVADFMQRLAALEVSTMQEPGSDDEFAAADSSSEAGADATRPSPLVWFQDFLAKLPAVVEFAELSAGAAHRAPGASYRSPVVRFTEPQRGMSVDLASVELAERAEALAAERGITYADALAQLREQHRAASTTA